MPEINAGSGPSETLLESSLESVDIAEQLVMEAASRNGVPEEDLPRIGMAVREAMVNAVVHGNRYNANKRVHLDIHRDRQRLIIGITDEGEGFDPAALPDPLAEENLLRQSGRGLLLMRAFVDEVDIRRAPPFGTRIELIVHIPSATG
jgi:serine/threonine-protein kinase RsbW